MCVASRHDTTCRSDVPKYRFAEPLRLDGGSGAGSIEGILVFSNVPLLAQMIGGKHTEAGVEGGRPLMPGLPCPAMAADVVDLTAHVATDTSVRSPSLAASTGARTPATVASPALTSLRGAALKTYVCVRACVRAYSDR
jgi:hypothetical protein